MNIHKLVATGFIASLAIGLSSAALAQGAALGGPEGEAAQAQQTQPEAAPAPAQAAGNPQVVAFVDSQFAKADTDGNGTLSAAEFTAWISGLKTAELQKAGQPADPATVKSYADAALATADKSKSGALTKADLVAFFGG